MQDSASLVNPFDSDTEFRSIVGRRRKGRSLHLISSHARPCAWRAGWANHPRLPPLPLPRRQHLLSCVARSSLSLPRIRNRSPLDKIGSAAWTQVRRSARHAGSTHTQRHDDGPKLEDPRPLHPGLILFLLVIGHTFILIILLVDSFVWTIARFCSEEISMRDFFCFYFWFERWSLLFYF